MGEEETQIIGTPEQEEMARRRRLWLWVANLTGLLLGYVFVSPAIPAMMMATDMIQFENRILILVLQWFYSPLEWLYENAEWYESYVDWQSSLII